MSANPFAVDDLRKKILSFYIQERCFECKKPLIEYNSRMNHFEDYKWRRAKCKKSKKFNVCNWCHHYVWERQ